jgi:hypothetical protein
MGNIRAAAAAMALKEVIARRRVCGKESWLGAHAVRRGFASDHRQIWVRGHW